jgi:predicted amidohydrolase YtcJ
MGDVNPRCQRQDRVAGLVVSGFFDSHFHLCSSLLYQSKALSN